jgi:phosphatidylserine/phosphatidylglycerophosphate/cardiolipin synthase-like enzyme
MDPLHIKLKIFNNPPALCRNSAKVFCFVLVFILYACTTNPPPTSTSGITPTAGWYEVFFTDPDSPTAGTFRGGPDEVLANAIRAARLSVDAAIYHLNLWSIRDALIAAHDAGASVRVVVESDNMDEIEVQDLRDAGIEVLGDRRESLMHHKFVVIDKSDVWTGSMNFTINGAYYNDNNLIHIRSTRLAENYTTEFEEMFVTDMFGDDVVTNTPLPKFSIDSSSIETYFSPDDGTAARIVDLVQQSRENIYFMAYSFTSDEIADAILEQADAGIRVAGVFEESQYYANIGTEFDRLRDAGLDVNLDGNPRLMHHKVIILDGAVVITGSYNFSRSAEIQNDENTLILHNPDIASQYLSEFERVFGQSVQE